jgi:hypothetical protein
MIGHFKHAPVEVERVSHVLWHNIRKRSARVAMYGRFLAKFKQLAWHPAQVNRKKAVIPVARWTG